MSVYIEDTETISPEDNFDNGLIMGYIEKALSSESRLFTNYNHYEIYELKLSGYSNRELAKMYKRDGYEIVIVSGRSDRTKEATDRWLEKYGVLYDRMIMRKRKNFTPDNELKERWLEKYLDPDNIHVVVDDRQRVVDMWRRNGLDVFQVANGNF